MGTGSAPSTTECITPVFDRWVYKVHTRGWSSMDGYTLNLAEFEDILPKAVEAGYGDVSLAEAEYVLRGLRYGFDLEHDESLMPPGQTYYRNYKSAFDNSQKITDALLKRVRQGKTLKLGPWQVEDGFPHGEGCNVPNGGVPKKLEPDVIRPVSDHTKTQFNAASRSDRVKHTLDTYNEIALALEKGFYI